MLSPLDQVYAYDALLGVHIRGIIEDLRTRIEDLESQSKPAGQQAMIDRLISELASARRPTE